MFMKTEKYENKLKCYKKHTGDFPLNTWDPIKELDFLTDSMLIKDQEYSKKKERLIEEAIRRLSKQKEADQELVIEIQYSQNTNEKKSQNIDFPFLNVDFNLQNIGNVFLIKNFELFINNLIKFLTILFFLRVFLYILVKDKNLYL